MLLPHIKRPFLKKRKKKYGSSLSTWFSSTIFAEKYFSCYILSPDQISLSGSFYFVRYWEICILQLFVNQVVTSYNLKLNLSFQSSSFFLYDQKVKTKLYISWERKKLFKSILHHFERAFIDANNTTFLEGESPALMNYYRTIRMRTAILHMGSRANFIAAPCNFIKKRLRCRVFLRLMALLQSLVPF